MSANFHLMISTKIYFDRHKTRQQKTPKVITISLEVAMNIILAFTANKSVSINNLKPVLEKSPIKSLRWKD